ncbi:hypothetical protein C8Q70DRAFT_541143 [Cubamyces menziesii]|uniref:BTB domain-containing protein n=1 Tax=Trametes cubensis TaxID=1111947 RepID=A0AAD7U0N7_9APHY|nr:hypothetical protein C8Q70DRAFT_541143 [Cubamyces menziesii]KAJ8494697.1 hypothetical protein ONZ51_g2171 [Trametes cubensis]
MSASSPAPYQDPAQGDLILRTSDGIQYHVLQRRLADVSPVFSNIFLRLSPLSEGEELEEPVVDVSEPSCAWIKVLPLVYNAKEPDLSLEDIGNVIGITKTYRMEGVQSRMRTHLLGRNFVDTDPHTVYLLACAGGFEDIARIAARAWTLYVPNKLPETSAYDAVSGRTIYRLLEYRRRCAQAAVAAIKVSSFTLNDQTKWLADVIPRHCGSKSCLQISFGGRKMPQDSLTTNYYWFSELDLLVQCLGSNLSPLIPNVDRLSRRRTERSNCLFCQSSMFDNAQRFDKALEHKIAEVVSQVELEF